MTTLRPELRAERPALGGTRHTHALEQAVSEHARRQHGVIARRQLLARGVTPRMIERWTERSFLHRLHRGVYAVGHTCLSFEGRCMAAVLAVGPGSRVTGRAAAWLRRSVRHPPRVIDVASMSQPRRRIECVAVVRTRVPFDDDEHFVDRIPVVSPSRMLVDLARSMRVTELADVMHELDFHDLLHVGKLRRIAARFRNRRGNAHRRLIHAIDLNQSGSAGTQSQLERKALDYLLDHGAPMPRVTPRFRLGGRYVRPDLYFEGARLAVEIDGPPHRRTRTRVDDEKKSELFADADIPLMRIGYRTFERDADAVLAVLGIRRT